MTYVIAEIGNNHNGSLVKAKELVALAATTGADAVKIQSFTGLDIVTPTIKTSEYPEWDSGKFEYWYQYVDSLALPLSDHQELIDFTNSFGMDFITTPVSPSILAFLETLSGIAAYKVASMDLTNTKLLSAIGGTGKPVIMSTGMGRFAEVQEAIKSLSSRQVSVLHCVSDYPLDPQEAALNNINFLIDSLPNHTVGFSDHSLGHELTIAAVALGAKVIEKHFTADRADPNPAEHHFSMMPDEFETMVSWIRAIEKGSQESFWSRSNGEELGKQRFRRSYHYKYDLPAGTVIELDHLNYLRPGNGLDNSDLNEVLGKPILRAVTAHDACILEHFAH